MGEEIEWQRMMYNKHTEYKAQIEEMTNEEPSEDLMSVSIPITLL